MRRRFSRFLGVPVLAIILIVLQLVCAALFLVDLVLEFVQFGSASIEASHLVLETTAILCLLAGIAFEWREGKRLLRRTVILEEELINARKTVFDLIEAHFENWGLTPSERDIANFVVKGLTTTQISTLRDCTEATVKAHLNAIYRKSGTVNRAGMLSHVIDSLVDGSFDKN